MLAHCKSVCWCSFPLLGKSGPASSSGPVYSRFPKEKLWGRLLFAHVAGWKIQGVVYLGHREGAVSCCAHGGVPTGAAAVSELLTGPTRARCSSMMALVGALSPRSAWEGRPLPGGTGASRHGRETALFPGPDDNTLPEASYFSSLGFIVPLLFFFFSFPLFPFHLKPDEEQRNCPALPALPRAWRCCV